MTLTTARHILCRFMHACPFLRPDAGHHMTAGTPFSTHPMNEPFQAVGTAC